MFKLINSILMLVMFSGCTVDTFTITFTHTPIKTTKGK